MVTCSGIASCNADRRSRGTNLPWPIFWLEVTCYDQRPVLYPFQQLGKTIQVTCMVLPKSLPFRPSSGLGPGPAPGNADSDHCHLTNWSLRYSGHVPPGRHALMPQIVNALPGFPRPQHDLPHVLPSLVSSVGLRADHMPAWGQQLCVRFGQADNVRSIPGDPFADFRGPL